MAQGDDVCWCGLEYSLEYSTDICLKWLHNRRLVFVSNSEKRLFSCNWSKRNCSYKSSLIQWDRSLSQLGELETKVLFYSKRLTSTPPITLYIGDNGFISIRSCPLTRYLLERTLMRNLRWDSLTCHYHNIRGPSNYILPVSKWLDPPLYMTCWN